MCHSKNIPSSFLFLTIADLQPGIRQPESKILSSAFFNLVTLDDLDSMRVYQRLRRVLRSISGVTHAVSPAPFQYDAAALSGEAAMADSRKSDL